MLIVRPVSLTNLVDMSQDPNTLMGIPFVIVARTAEAMQRSAPVADTLKPPDRALPER
jgi:hypothetical protein